MHVSWKKVQEGLLIGLIKLINCPNCKEIACQIGEHWFYFDTRNDWWYRQLAAAQYTDTVGHDTTAQMIAEALQSLSADSPDEFLYYYFFLQENGLQIIEDEPSVNELIANARKSSGSDDAPGSRQTGMDKHNTQIHEK